MYYILLEGMFLVIYSLTSNNIPICTGTRYKGATITMNFISNFYDKTCLLARDVIPYLLSALSCICRFMNEELLPFAYKYVVGETYRIICVLLKFHHTRF